MNQDLLIADNVLIQGDADSLTVQQLNQARAK